MESSNRADQVIQMEREIVHKLATEYRQKGYAEQQAHEAAMAFILGLNKETPEEIAKHFACRVTEKMQKS